MSRRVRSLALASVGLLALAGCTHVPSTSASAHDAFFVNLQALCGQAFAGAVEVDRPVMPGNGDFAGKPLVMHVRDCDEDTVRIPFNVGGDRSRTWVVDRTDTGLRLKHDHRHPDGTSDAVTMYGGDTKRTGSPARQEFPVDAESVAMFGREGLAASVANTWAMELQPGQRFVYELARRGGRLFRVAFDLSAPVLPPPPPWGSD